MREFNVERHFRDVRITNIYEGTSQLQVVAALGKMVGRGLDVLFGEWKSMDYGAGLDGLKEDLVAASVQFGACCDSLKERERDAIDFHGADLVGMAAFLVPAWILLRDARDIARKREVIAFFVAERLPGFRASAERILGAKSQSAAAREAILAR